MADSSKSTEQKHHKFLATEYCKFQCLCRIMEELSFEVRSDADDKSELAEKSDNLQYLAITIKDLLVRAEEAFLDAIDTYDRVEEKEDFRHLLSFWGYLKEKDKKILMQHAIVHTQQKEDETDCFTPGNWFYDLRRSLAKKYEVTPDCTWGLGNPKDES